MLSYSAMKLGYAAAFMLNTEYPSFMAPYDVSELSYNVIKCSNR
jgi:hypothetical protein